MGVPTNEDVKYFKTFKRMPRKSQTAFIENCGRNNKSLCKNNLKFNGGHILLFLGIIWPLIKQAEMQELTRRYRKRAADA